MLGLHHGSEHVSERFHRLPRQGTGGGQTTSRWRFNPGGEDLADPRAGGRNERRQAIQSVGNVLLVAFRLILAGAVGFLGLQEP